MWKDRPYGTKSDLWSLGVVLYEMAALRPPFNAPDMKGLYTSVTRGVYPEPSAFYSNDLKSIIRVLLSVDSTKRPSTKDLLSNPILIARTSKDAKFAPYRDSSYPTLLNTIKVPGNLRYLNDMLPRGM